MRTLRLNSARMIAKIIFFSALALNTAAGRAYANDLVLEDMLREVKVALLRVQQTADSDALPPLQEAVLELKATQTTDAIGKVSFYIVKLGGGTKSEAVHTIKLTLVPPDANAGEDVSTLKFADMLAQSILSSARAIKAARRGEPPLLAKELVVTIQFGLTLSGEGGLTFVFPPFEASLGGKHLATTVNKIVVTYKVE